MSTRTELLKSTGEFFHVYNRGVASQKIFFDDRNYVYFHKRMSESVDDASIEIIVYCLMPSHYHLILRQIKEFGISKFISEVCDGYAKAVNRERSRSGHLFGGKFKLKRIDQEEYLLHLSRYIHLNPVRAGIVAHPEDWHYSSCREYYGMRNDVIVRMNYILSQFMPSDEYKKFVELRVQDDICKIGKYLFYR